MPESDIWEDLETLDILAFKGVTQHARSFVIKTQIRNVVSPLSSICRWR